MISISCLTTSSLPWFMDLTFQVPMQCCFLQHPTLLLPPDTSTTEHHFYFGSAASFFLELLVIALCSSALAYWTPSNMGLTFQSHISLPFHTVHGVLEGRYWNGLQFPTPVAHVLSQFFTMTCLSWVALHGMAHIFIELCKPLHHDKVVIHERDPLGLWSIRVVWYFIWNLNFSQSHSRGGNTVSCLQ